MGHDEKTTLLEARGDAVNSIIDLAVDSIDPVELDPSKLYHVTLPAGSRGEIVDLTDHLAKHAPHPHRVTGTYTPHDVASFVAYVDEHQDPAHSTIWIDLLAARLVAVLNDHASTATGWGDHRAALQLQHTPEWKHWSGKDGQWLTQETFAEHIRDGIMEIVEPDGATMLEIAQTFEGKTKADWKSATRIDNGQVSFVYQEEIQAGAGRQGDLEIPSQLLLAIAPFYGEQPAPIAARFRYRIKEGTLSLGYKLEKPQEVLQRSVNAIADRLRGEHGFKRVYMGAPR
jgi:uncharacterized protein YfdQ (DUF2303 family)